MIRPRLTVPAVRKALGDMEFEVIEEDDGIRICKKIESGRLDDETRAPMTHIVKAALYFNLYVEQFEDNSTYRDERQGGSSWTGEWGDQVLNYDVKFLYKEPK